MTYTRQPTELDWARLAAYIDGEGCISIGLNHLKRTHRPPILFLEVAVTNTDPRLPNWIQSAFGGIIMTTYRDDHPEWATSIKWYAACKIGAAILRGCLPYFVIKREQAEVALAFQQTTKKWGVKGRPAHIVELQFRYREQLQTLKGTSSRASKLPREQLVSCL